jgi:putative transposase
LTQQIRYKAESVGSSLKLVGPPGTSQTCPECGTIEHKTLAKRMHGCDCGVVLDGDVADVQIILIRADFISGTGI